MTGSLVTRTPGGNGLSPFAGTYAVTPDCFATDTLTATTGAVSTHTYAIFNAGRGFFILNTTVGAPNIIVGEGHQTGTRDDE